MGSKKSTKPDYQEVVGLFLWVDWMKRLLFAVFVLLAAAVPANAAGTLTGCTAQTDWADVGNGNWACTVTWVDDTSGTTGTILVPPKLYGTWAAVGVTDPGATAPTDNYDIVVSSTVSGHWAALDVFDGNLLNRDSSATEKATWSYAPFPAYGSLTFTLSGNAVNNATGTLTIILSDGDSAVVQ